MVNFNTPWWDGFCAGLFTSWSIYLFNEYVIKIFRKAWKQTTREMKKRENNG